MHISASLGCVLLYRWNLQPATPAVLQSLRKFLGAVASGNPARVDLVLADIAKRAKAEDRAAKTGGRKPRVRRK
jgi:hypothetical protein